MLGRRILSAQKLITTSAVVLGLSLSAQVAAKNPDPKVKIEAPDFYHVKKGDTLWGISSKYLQEPWRWKEIWATNKQIRNPHNIWPGDKLILCIIEGKRMVGLDDGKGCEGLAQQVKQEKAAPATMPAVQTQPQPQGSIIYEKLTNAVPTLPLSTIKPWLYHAQVVDPVALKNTPYVLASKTKNIITGVGNKIYVRGPLLTLGQEYGVYRVGKAYRDPKSKRNLGQEVYQVATGVVTEVKNNGVSSVEINKSFREEVREGDRVFIDLSDTLYPIYYPQPGNVLGNPKVVRVHGSLGNAAQNSVVVVSIGQKQGAKTGQVFAIYKKGALVRDDFSEGEAVRLPSERAGMLMLFKTFDQVSYGYVLESETDVSIGDELKSPVNSGD